MASHLRWLANERGRVWHPEFSVIVFGAWRDDPRCGLGRILGQQVSEDIPGRLAEKLDRVSSRLECDLLVILINSKNIFSITRTRTARAGSPASSRKPSTEAFDKSFLISIREDSLAKLDRFEGAIPGILGNRLRVDH